MRRSPVFASLVAFAALGVVVSACTDRAAAAKAAPSSAGADSSRYAIAVQLAAFRQGLPEVHRLEGFTSRDALVRAFAEAVRRNDRAALERLALTRAEFAYLYYPESPLSKKPYELDPELHWMQLSARSGRGLTRLLQTHGGRLAYRGYRCEAAPQRLGRIALHDACTVTLVVDGREAPARLFGSIIEQDGRFKFVGFSNKL